MRITSPDVQGIFAWWVGDDVSRVWRVASRYRLTSEEAGMLYGVTPSGAEAVVAEAWTAESFSLWVGNDLMEERPNPYGFIPFIVFPNLREPKQFWGSADITALMEPQREINRAFSQLSTILELSGNPIAVLEGVEEAQDIAVQPGAVWEVPERARAYLLDLLQGGGVRLHTEYIELLYRVLHDLSETPRTAFGDSGRNLSGVALEMELYPMVQRVARKRLQRNSVYRHRAELALRVHQQRTGEECWPVRLRTTWGTALPQDRDRLVQQEGEAGQRGPAEPPPGDGQRGHRGPRGRTLAGARRGRTVPGPAGDGVGAASGAPGQPAPSPLDACLRSFPRRLSLGGGAHGLDQRLGPAAPALDDPRDLQRPQAVLHGHGRVCLNVEHVGPRVVGGQDGPDVFGLDDADHLRRSLDPVLCDEAQAVGHAPSGPSLRCLVDLLPCQMRLERHQVDKEHFTSSYSPLIPAPITA